MVASLLEMANLDWAVPEHTTQCRRQKTLAVQITYRRADGPLNLLVDIESASATGSSEPARVHQVPRRWRVAGAQARYSGATPIVARQEIAKQSRDRGRKVHLAMDTATSDIRAVEFTPSSDGDSPVLPELLDQNCSTSSPRAKKSAQ